MRLVQTLIGSGQRSNVSYMIPLEFSHRASADCVSLQTLGPAAETRSPPKEASDPCTGKPVPQWFKQRADELASNLWVITHKRTTQNKQTNKQAALVSQWNRPHMLTMPMLKHVSWFLRRHFIDEMLGCGYEKFRGFAVNLCAYKTSTSVFLVFLPTL